MLLRAREPQGPSAAARWEGAGAAFPLWASGGTSAAGTLSLDRWPRELRGDKSLLFGAAEIAGIPIRVGGYTSPRSREARPAG